MMGGGPYHRYFQTKLANSVFTYALHDKLQAKNSKVHAICAHPSGSNTNLGDHLNYGFVMNAVLQYVVMPLMAQSPQDGAMGSTMGMMDQDAQLRVLYGPWSERSNASAMSGKAVPNPPKPYEMDETSKDMLWRTSEEATGVKFTI